MTNLTEDQLEVLDRNCASYPFKLTPNCDISKPFVYYRKYGLFYVPMGYHSFVMASLMAFDHNVKNHYALLKLPEFMSYDGVQDIAHIFLEETEGVAYRSAISGSNIVCQHPSYLTAVEKRIFRYVDYSQEL